MSKAKEIGVRLAILRFSISGQVVVKTHGHVGREFKLRPFSAGSILTLRNRIEPLASTTSLARTPRKMQSNKTHSVNNCAGKTGDPYYLRTGRLSPFSHWEKGRG